MNHVDRYLLPPADYVRTLGGLRWSPDGEAVERGDGSTFALAGEVVSFLEGFACERPPIAFGHVLHFLYLLRTELPGGRPGREPLDALRSSFRRAGQIHRNAGALAGVLCQDLPAVPRPPGTWDVWQRVILRATGPWQAAGESSPPGDVPPLSPEAFEAHLTKVLAGYTQEDLLAWFRTGQGSVRHVGEQLARATLVRPRSLAAVLAELARQPRLGGAVPYVAQLVSALSLPPRRLPERGLPLGGYADVATRGHPEQVLLSQFALEELDFLRRHAENELLYFRREEPQANLREELLVVLDQGVRTWGEVRLVLTAALFALGQLAGRRRLPFRIAVTGDRGTPHDPLTTEPAALARLLEASDLSSTPGLALESALEEPTAGLRDVVLLTHPRALAEADVLAAARRVSRGVRLFGVTVDRQGHAELSELRGGNPLSRGRFRVDLSPRPTPVEQAPQPRDGWSGPVEPVGFPFRFGIESSPQHRGFAFDHDGDWLLVAGSDGYLLAMRTDGSLTEMLPRAMLPRPTRSNTVLSDVTGVLGVAGGFVVTGRLDGIPAAAHYDFVRRHCALFVVSTERAGTWLYRRSRHALLFDEDRDRQCHSFDLSTAGSRMPRERRQAVPEAAEGDGTVYLQVVDHGHPGDPPRDAAALFQDGSLMHIDREGSVDVLAPEEDGAPLLLGLHLVAAARCRDILAASCEKAPGGSLRLYVFYLPDRAYLGNLPLGRGYVQFALSNDGRLLAFALGPNLVEVREVVRGLPWRFQTPVCRFHSDVGLTLGERWLTLQCPADVFFFRWDRGRLEVVCGTQSPGSIIQRELHDTDLARSGARAQPNALPPFLAYDPERFRLTAWSNLLAVVDRFGQVALCERSGELVCMLFAFRGKWAAWLPDGTGWGSESLLGRPPTIGGDVRIGQALQEAWERGEGTVTL
jgi:hypothetical protein